MRKLGSFRVHFRGIWAELIARDGDPDRIRHINNVALSCAISNPVMVIAASLAARGTVPGGMLLAWMGGMAVLSLLMAWFGNPKNWKPIRRISKRTRRRFVVNAVLYGLAWSPLPVVFLFLNDVQSTVMLAVCWSVMVGAALAYSVIPVFAIAFFGAYLLPAVAFAVEMEVTTHSYIVAFMIAVALLLVVFCYRYAVAMRDVERRSRERAYALKMLEKAHGDIQILAQNDVTTGLANRRSLLSMLDERCALEDASGALFVVDLDHFKHINDAYGHEMGDAYLTRMGQIMDQVTGDAAHVGRLGGDEFAILTRAELSHPELRDLGERLLVALNGFMEIDDVSLRTGATIGAAHARFASHSSETWLTFADHALRMAKAHQRGTIRFFSSEDKAQMTARNFLGVELANAIANHEIEPWYQPKIDLHSGELIGYEVLARWRTAAGHDVPPPRFFDLAEQIGLILDLSELIFRRAARELAAHIQAEGHSVNVALNIHPVQLHHIDRLLEVLDEVGAQIGDPGQITLEITENCIVGRGTEEIPVALERLVERGYRLSLDDFGTGYASLTHIQTLPIHEVKIDRIFIRDIAQTSTDREIVRSVLRIARLRNISVVAEGIEAPDQIAILRSAGCEIGQGYYFARPMPSAKLLSYAQSYRQWTQEQSNSAS